MEISAWDAKARIRIASHLTCVMPAFAAVICVSFVLVMRAFACVWVHAMRMRIFLRMQCERVDMRTFALWLKQITVRVKRTVLLFTYRSYIVRVSHACIRYPRPKAIRRWIYIYWQIYWFSSTNWIHFKDLIVWNRCWVFHGALRSVHRESSTIMKHYTESLRGWWFERSNVAIRGNHQNTNFHISRRRDTIGTLTSLLWQ